MAISKKSLKLKMEHTALLTLELLEIGEMELAGEFSGVCSKVQKVLSEK